MVKALAARPKVKDEGLGVDVAPAMGDEKRDPLLLFPAVGGEVEEQQERLRVRGEKNPVVGWPARATGVARVLEMDRRLLGLGGRRGPVCGWGSREMA